MRWFAVVGVALSALLGLAPAVAADPGLAASVQRARLQADPHLVTLSGTYTCGPFTGGGEWGVLDLSLLQGEMGPPGGIGYVYPEVCDGTPQPWTETVETFGDPFRRGAALAGYPLDARELIVEATYRAPLNRRLTLQPDIQYVVNPGGRPASPDALTLGLRAEIGF